MFLHQFGMLNFEAVFEEEVERDDQETDGRNDEGELHRTGHVGDQPLDGGDNRATDQSHNDDGTTSFGVFLFGDGVQRVGVNRWPFRTEEEAGQDGRVNGDHTWNREGHDQRQGP